MKTPLPCSRRGFLKWSALGASAALLGCGRSNNGGEAALRAAGNFLAARQGEDGAWRSGSYGAFRGGDALTPLVLWAMDGMDEAFARGIRWLEKLTETQAKCAAPWSGLAYPLFTAGYSAQVFAAAGDGSRARFWAGVVESLRISPALGWPVEAAACGAWGDAPAPPRWPQGVAHAPDMLAPNISATVLAIQALRAAERDGAQALPFLAQCQNFAERSRSGFDDGGFFFAPGDAVRNKAGGASGDRYHSYGSATCDGALALQGCGVPAEATRLQAALAWLRQHADGAEHAGTWAPGRAAERASLRYYYAQGLAPVLALGKSMGAFQDWSALQRRALSGDLLAAQSADGSWANACPDSFEDEPIVATAFAVRALRICAQGENATA